MNRSILILAVVTGLFAGAALLSTRNHAELTAADDPASAGGPLFPVLEERVNDVTEVTVTGQDGSFTVKREGDSWGALDKGGYPIDFSKVKALVVGVSGFDVIEPKTANPAYHAKLGVEAPDAADSESKRVTLKDDAGTVLADVIVGDARAAAGRGGGQPSLYARRADEDQAYEVTGRLVVDANAANWLDRKIVALPQERVAAVTITHPDGEVLRVSRTSADETDFAVADLPEGRELVWEGVARSVATAAQNLSLEDVGRAGELFDFDAAETTVAEYRTFDGLVLTATTAQADDKTYLAVAARAEDVPAPPAPPAPEEDEGDGEGDAEADAAEDEGPTFEEVQAEAEEINARVGGWVYVVPGWSATNLRKRMDELLKPVEPETPDPPALDELLDQEGQPLPEGLQEAIQESLGGDGQ